MDIIHHVAQPNTIHHVAETSPKNQATRKVCEACMVVISE